VDLGWIHNLSRQHDALHLALDHGSAE
jgi:hypothetical protein